MKAIIINNNEWGGNCTDEHIENNESLFLDCFFTDLLPDNNIIKKIWNGSEWIEGATPQEILEASKPIVPQEISAMDLKLQLFDLGITDQDIFYDIDSIPDSMFPQSEKQKAKIKYQTAAKFERHNADLNLVATMEGITQEQLDQIFINGNLR